MAFLCRNFQSSLGKAVTKFTWNGYLALNNACLREVSLCQKYLVKYNGSPIFKEAATISISTPFQAHYGLTLDPWDMKKTTEFFVSGMFSC